MVGELMVDGPSGLLTAGRSMEHYPETHEIREAVPVHTGTGGNSENFSGSGQAAALGRLPRFQQEHLRDHGLLDYGPRTKRLRTTDYS